MGVAETPQYPTPEWNDYVPGGKNENKSLPLKYEMTGQILEVPTEQSPHLVIMRQTRNGVERVGIFRSSVVQEVIEIKPSVFEVYTENSVYKVEVNEDQHPA